MADEKTDDFDRVSSANLEAIVKAEVEERRRRDRLLEAVADEATRGVLASLFDADDATRAELRTLRRESAALKVEVEALRGELSVTTNLVQQFGVGMSAISEAVELLESGELTEEAQKKITELTRAALAELAKTVKTRVLAIAGSTGVSVPVLIHYLRAAFGG